MPDARTDLGTAAYKAHKLPTKLSRPVLHHLSIYVGLMFRFIFTDIFNVYYLSMYVALMFRFIFTGIVYFLLPCRLTHTYICKNIGFLIAWLIICSCSSPGRADKTALLKSTRHRYENMNFAFSHHFRSTGRVKVNRLSMGVFNFHYLSISVAIIFRFIFTGIWVVLPLPEQWWAVPSRGYPRPGQRSVNLQMTHSGTSLEKLFDINIFQSFF